MLISNKMKGYLRTSRVDPNLKYDGYKTHIKLTIKSTLPRGIQHLGSYSAQVVKAQP